MLSQLSLDSVAIAGISLWGLTLYLALATLRHRLFERLEGWLSQSLFQKSQGEGAAISASMLSVVFFLLLGASLHLLIAATLGNSWAISGGIMGAIGSGVYELGRLDSQMD